LIAGLLENAWLREELAKASRNTGRSVYELRELLPVWLLELKLSPIGRSFLLSGFGAHLPDAM
jgi:hypothetical protein